MADNGGRSGVTRSRRTGAEVELVKLAMIALLLADQPMTVRQVFYSLVSKGLIAKTEAEYKQTVVRLLGELRLEGRIPFEWIADNGRWARHPVTFSSPADALRALARGYRRSVWADQDVAVEVWLEKDALASVLEQETDPYDVSLMVTRGYPSLSFLYEAAQVIADVAKPTRIYYFGDHDPSGVDIDRNVQQRLRRFAPGAEISFQRVAVTRAQIEAMALPTRPTKRTDSRSANFDGDSVEVDAIPPATLRTLCRTAIEQHIDGDRLDALREAQETERADLVSIAEAMSGPTD